MTTQHVKVLIAFTIKFNNNVKSVVSNTKTSSIMKTIQVSFSPRSTKRKTKRPRDLKRRKGHGKEKLNVQPPLRRITSLAWKGQFDPTTLLPPPSSKTILTTIMFQLSNGLM